MAKERAQYINSLIHVAFVALCHTICTTDANRPEKKDHLLACYKNLYYRSYMTR